MPYTYETTNLTNLGQLKKLAQRTQQEIAGVKSTLANAILAATYSNNTLKLFRTTDTTGTAAFSFDLPEEMFLDQTHTEFVASFEWSSTTYPGSTNPNLDGKPVMVLAVKGDATNPSYSFLDMQALVDTYSANDASVVVSGYKINVQIDNTAGNALTLVSGKGLRVDISGKADKVSNATSGNFAGLDSNGNLTDSGSKAADFATAGHTHDDKADLDVIADDYDSTATYAVGDLCIKDGVLYRCSTAITTAEAWTSGHWTATDVDTELGRRDTAIGGKADKVASATNGHLAGLDGNGNLTDSGVAGSNVMQKVASATAGDFAKLNASGEVVDAGYGLASDTNVEDMIHDVWGDPEESGT